jgi:hypothetical protein
MRHRRVAEIIFDSSSASIEPLQVGASTKNQAQSARDSCDATQACEAAMSWALQGIRSNRLMQMQCIMEVKLNRRLSLIQAATRCRTSRRCLEKHLNSNPALTRAAAMLESRSRWQRCSRESVQQKQDSRERVQQMRGYGARNDEPLIVFPLRPPPSAISSPVMTPQNRVCARHADPNGGKRKKTKAPLPASAAAAAASAATPAASGATPASPATSVCRVN